MTRSASKRHAVNPQEVARKKKLKPANAVTVVLPDPVTGMDPTKRAPLADLEAGQQEGNNNDRGQPNGRRRKAATVAKREIRKYQKSEDFLIPQASMRRLIQEIIQDLKRGDFCITKEAVRCLHTAAEKELVKRFRRAKLSADAAGRETLEVNDMRVTS